MSNVKQYRKKPVVVEAIQFNGDNYDEVEKFTRGGFRVVPEDKLRETDLHMPYEMGVIAEVYDYAQETWVGVKANHWIIKGVIGEFYPCAPAVFDETFELHETTGRIAR